MSCEECEKIQNKVFSANGGEVAYYRIEDANVALVGCRKHLKMLIERLNRK